MVVTCPSLVHPSHLKSVLTIEVANDILYFIDKEDEKLLLEAEVLAVCMCLYI